jgi:hypothetical protein
MNCLWEDIPDSTDASGRRRVQCKRPGCRRKLNPTAAPQGRIFANCKALPLAWELGYWLTLFLGVWGISKRGVSMLKARLGLKPCKCDKREQATNGLGHWLYSLFSRRN